MQIKPAKKHYRRGIVDFARLKLGLSQQQLADALGVSRSLIAMMETGKREMPKVIKDVYLELCRKADAMNPNGFVTVKRGRKPAAVAADREFKAVTNSVVTNFKMLKTSGEAGTDQCANTLKTVMPMIKTGEAAQREQAIAQLKEKKNLLSYQYTGLVFKVRALEKRQQQLKSELGIATIFRNSNEKLAALLPDRKESRTYKGQAMYYDLQQYKLECKLEKFSPTAMLSTKLEMGLLEKAIEAIEQSVIKLEIEARKTVATSTVPLLPASQHLACA